MWWLDLFYAPALFSCGKEHTVPVVIGDWAGSQWISGRGGEGENSCSFRKSNFNNYLGLNHFATYNKPNIKK